MRLIDAVIFDLGGVLSRTGGPADVMRRYPDVDVTRMLELIMGPPGEDTDHPWHRAERGEITLDECRAANKVALAEAGITLPSTAGAGVSSERPPVSEAPTSPTSTGAGFAFEVNEAMVALVHEAKAAGLGTAVLTNNLREFRPAWRAMLPFDELFDTIVDSHEVGMRKPNPAIYHLTLERLGVTAPRAAFLDDLPANVQAGSALGLVSLLVHGDGHDAIAEVRRLAGLA